MFSMCVQRMSIKFNLIIFLLEFLFALLLIYCELDFKPEEISASMLCNLQGSRNRLAASGISQRPLGIVPL